MTQLLKQIDKYLFRKLRGLWPTCIVIYVTVPTQKYQELAGTFPQADQGEALAFSSGMLLLYILSDVA